MATFVLVGGAWMGAWVWQKVAAGLRADGHLVYPVTLTGLGDRVHLATRETSLSTHITDVVNTLIYEDLHDVVLVGHSYAGSVITGVADRLPDRLSALVYLDTAPFPDGMSLTDLNSPEGLASMQREVDSLGNGWTWPMPEFAELGQGASLDGISDADLALMRERAAPQPWATYTEPLHLTGTEGDYQRVVIACINFQQLAASGIPQIVALQAGPWRWLELSTGHWPMLSTPGELVTLLTQFEISVHMTSFIN